ncbi:S-adenosyl-L-methionine-dependent methyltransferase [Pleomassaria siparia CBS 279.74]|uniref:S-adenosyl-L-methionine-dependent methyltransferase n=1 Tax=Pleomassaria siparia CBS 279.74 TaxID=1314801 RepID=A0A6G1KDZ3_9PLEO|nr:S-adenosyl-L-methionine-dependent methyltransferase [Pleomassaria siparia CBS 279.74]
MSQPTPGSVTEKTFSAYTPEQSEKYASARHDYHSSLYETVLKYHSATGGELGVLLDVGCGPGNVTRALGSRFTEAIGLDPSCGMLETARSLGGTTSTSLPIRYELGSAEQLGENLERPIEEGSVDLITAANAAHWFDMPAFWTAAARVLKPGGTVALWTSGNVTSHPSVPNAEAIKAAFDKHHEDHLVAYYEPGNFLTRNRYATLPLPWTIATPIPDFDKTTFFRKDWELGETFYTGEQEIGMDMLEKMMSSSSPQVRWHQAHPDLVGTDKDIVRILRREIERLLHEAGVEKGKERVMGTVQGSLLMVKHRM